MADNTNIQIIIEAQNNTAPGFEAINTALESLQKLISDVSKAFEDFTQSLTSESGAAAQSIAEMSRPLTEVTTTADEAAQQIGTAFAEPARTAEEELSRIAEGLQNVSTAAEVSANAVAADFERAAAQSEEALTHVGHSAGGSGGHSMDESGLFGMSGQMNSMYAGMTLGAAAMPLDLSLKSAVKSFTDFDQSMRLVNQETKLGQDGFKSLSQSVLDLSNQTGISANDLSKGLYNVVATGLTDSKQAMNELTVAAEGAKAGNTDLDTSTKALNAVMGAYGLKADQATKIMDVMFTAVNNGQMHFDDLARSVGQSATSAAQAGVSYEDLAAAQATLTNVGKSAQLASSNLNALILGMLAPTAGATKEARALGIEWDAAALKANGLSNMINEAMKATGGNADELKKLIPNQRAYVAELALGGTANAQYTKTLEQMKNSTGATAKALEEYDKGTGESLERAKTSIQNAGIALVAGLEPAITSVSNAIINLSKWFQSLSPETQKVIGLIALGAAAFLTLGTAFFGVIAGIGALKMGLESLGLVSTAENVGLFTKAISAAGAALEFITGPWGVLILAIAAGVVAIIANWDKIKAWVTEHFGSTIPTNMTELKQKMTTVWTDIEKLFIEVWNQIKQVTTEVWGYIGPTITGAVQKIQAFWIQVWPELKELFVNVWNVMKVVLAPSIAGMYIVISAALGLIKGIWQDSWGIVKSFFKLIWDAIVDVLRVDWDVITGIFKVALDLLTGNWTKAWTDLKQLLFDTWNDIGKFLGDMATNAFQWGKNLIQGFIDGIKSTVSSVGSAVSSVVQSAKNFLGFHSPAKEGPGSDADTWAPNLVNMFAGGILDGANAVSAAATKMMQPLRNAMTAVMAGNIGNVSASFTGSVAQNVALAGSSRGSSNPITINVYAQGNITRSERELGDIVSTALLNKVQQQYNLNF